MHVQSVLSWEVFPVFFLAESLAITCREQAVENSDVLKVDFICKANVFGVRCSRTLSAPSPPPPPTSGIDCKYYFAYKSLTGETS